jgi:alpha-1,6-mannosyltransferase
MKVVDVTEFYSERGGGVRSYLEAKEHILCQLGHESSMLVPGPPSKATRTVRRLGGPAMPYDPTYHLLWRPDKIRDAIATACPDVVEIHSPYVAALGVLAAKRGTYGIRTFVWHSDFIDTYERVFVDDLLRRLRADGHRAWARPAARAASVPLWAWVRAIARGCAATFCSSAWQTRKLARHGVAAEHLPFGVDKEIFHPRPRAPSGVTLVASGRLAIEKRWDTVLEGFARFAEAHSGARLVVYGDGPERARLEKLASKNVYFAGFEKDREKLGEAIAAADALVHGCPHETFGIAVAEAIASGVPLVVPDEGGAAELAKPEFSETFRAGDPAGCAAAIERLLSRGPSAREAAARAAREILSTREHFERLLARYEELLGKVRRAPV